MEMPKKIRVVRAMATADADAAQRPFRLRAATTTPPKNDAREKRTSTVIQRFIVNLFLYVMELGICSTRGMVAVAELALLCVRFEKMPDSWG